jgi:hypothetical protein
MKVTLELSIAATSFLHQAEIYQNLFECELDRRVLSNIWFLFQGLRILVENGIDLSKLHLKSSKEYEKEAAVRFIYLLFFLYLQHTFADFISFHL